MFCRLKRRALCKENRAARQQRGLVGTASLWTCWGFTSPAEDYIEGKLDLNELMVANPAELWAALGISRQGAMDLRHPLIEAGLVEKIGSKKTGRYMLRNP